MADFKATEAFLEALDGVNATYVFQTFIDNKNSDVDLKPRQFTGTFAKLKKALTAQNEFGAGIYVQVNDGEKRGKKYISRVRALFVDLDEPSTAMASLSAIKKHMPMPNILTNSSKNKFHLYWRVKDCSLDEFAAAQTALAVKFNTDVAIKNLDRVMRLPGFMHQKNDPQMVTSRISDDQYIYETNELLDCAKKATTLSAPKLPSAKEFKESSDTDCFGLDIGDGYKTPDTVAKGGRTNAMIKFIGHQIAIGFSAVEAIALGQKFNREIISPPLDEKRLELEVWGAAHKWEAERDAETEAMLETDAIPPAPTPDNEAPINTTGVPKPPIKKEKHSLGTFIERFRYIKQGSRVIDTHSSGRHSEYSLADFKNATANILIPGKNRPQKLFDKWFQHADRKDFRDTIYYPSEQKIIQEGSEEFWNIYSPTEVVPSDKVDMELIKVFTDHIKYMFPLKKDFKVFMDWMAMTVQKPEVRIPWAPLIISTQGVGKGFIYQVLAQLVGAQNSTVILPDRLESQFNPYMSGSTLILVDEMRVNSRYNPEDKIKSYISEPTIEINRKGQQEHTAKVYANFLIFTNHAHATRVEEYDRRFWIYKVPHNKKTPKYYREIFSWFLDNALSMPNLLKYFMEYDLSNFEFAAVPEATAAKRHMIDSGKSELTLEIEDAILHRDGLFAAEIISYAVFKDYVEQSTTVATKPKDGILKHMYSQLFIPLDNHKVKSGVVPTGDVSKQRQRVRCIRNGDVWNTSERRDVADELSRCIKLAAGHADPKLAANGDTNATESNSTRH